MKRNRSYTMVLALMLVAVVGACAGAGGAWNTAICSSKVPANFSTSFIWSKVTFRKAAL